MLGHATGMTQHPLDRQMGLAGIGRAENGQHIAIGWRDRHGVTIDHYHSG
jgi:hypothetical protein